jgi:hypothetical protein
MGFLGDQKAFCVDSSTMPTHPVTTSSLLFIYLFLSPFRCALSTVLYVAPYLNMYFWVSIN